MGKGDWGRGWMLGVGSGGDGGKGGLAGRGVGKGRLVGVAAVLDGCANETEGVGIHLSLPPFGVVGRLLALWNSD